VDAPELDAAEGKKARAFVERVLAKVDHIILTSSRPDKYGRYLADVFYREDEKEGEAFLNQRLLEEHLAVKR
jgi:endonuclease YncB( thermonuclease family)